MKLKIVNKRKFILSLTFIISILFLIILGNTTSSSSKERYTTILVSSGDTLWNIAKNEQENNPYYESKDIRYIVNDIKAVNNLKSGNLANNQKLNIPII